MIPRVNYTNEELKTWQIIYQQLTALYPTHACKQHISALKVLENECNYSENSIPQLEDVSRFLRSTYTMQKIIIFSFLRFNLKKEQGFR